MISDAELQYQMMMDHQRRQDMAAEVELIEAFLLLLAHE